MEGFWRYFSYLPMPSDVFTEVAPASSGSSRCVRHAQGRGTEQA